MVFNIRPYAEEFLNTMSREFELVVFTAGEQDVSPYSKLSMRIRALQLKSLEFVFKLGRFQIAPYSKNFNQY